MKRIALIISLVLAIVGCTPNKISDKELNGGYIATNAFNISSMTFNHEQDNLFKWDMSVMNNRVIVGHYAIKGDEIVVMCNHKVDGILTFKIGDYREETTEGVTLKKLHLDWVVERDTLAFELLGVKKEN